MAGGAKMGLREWLGDLNHRVFVKTIIFSVLLVVLYWSHHNGVIAQQQKTCADLNQTKAALVGYFNEQIERAKTTLPTLQYYKDHPRELGEQLQLLRQQQMEFNQALAPTKC